MRFNRLFVPFICFLLSSTLFAQDQKLQVSDIVSRHLASIGTPQARTAIKSRTVRTTVQMKNVVGTAGSIDGTGIIVSFGDKSSIAMRFPSQDYRGEQFVFDGSKVNIGLIGPAKRSAIGEFLYLHDDIVRNGLLGGTLTTSWTLLNENSKKVQLKYEGLKKVDGRMLHDVSYSPKKGDRDLLIHFFFEPDTFRHVKTEYSYDIDPSLDHNQRVHGTFTKYRVEEIFSDFKTVDGVTLPSLWKLRYSAISDKTVVIEWQTITQSVQHNNVTD